MPELAAGKEGQAKPQKTFSIVFHAPVPQQQHYRKIYAARSWTAHLKEAVLSLQLIHYPSGQVHGVHVAVIIQELLQHFP